MSTPPGPARKALPAEMKAKQQMLSPSLRKESAGLPKPGYKRKRIEIVVIGDVQPQARRSSDPDVQIISETSQSSKPSIKDQLEQQMKALQDMKKE